MDNTTQPVDARIRLLTHTNCSAEVVVLGTKDYVPIDILYLAKNSIALLGVLLNAISLILFSKLKQRKSVFVTLLILLSLTEVTYGLGAVIFEVYYLIFIIHSYSLASVWTSVISGYSILYGVWVVYKSSLLSRNWLIVLIAWRRYCAIRDPLATHRTLSRKNVNRLFVVICLTCVAVTVPRVFEMGYGLCTKSVQFSYSGDAQLMKIKSYVNIYHTLFFLCTSPLPISAVIFCSLVMLRQLYQRDSMFGFAANQRQPVCLGVESSQRLLYSSAPTARTDNRAITSSRQTYSRLEREAFLDATLYC